MEPTHLTPIASTSQLPAEAESSPHGFQFNLADLPPDADVSLAPDGSFVETSSGTCARELKRFFDQHYGVCKEVRSPFVITAFVNQHGKPMYRVGNRQVSSAPAAHVEPEVAPVLSRVANGRKLRKTRSIPSISDSENVVSGRQHSQSVTAADMPRYALVPQKRPGDRFLHTMRLQPTQPSSLVSLPFGPGVSFDSPVRTTVTVSQRHLATPRVLREMQSFESGLTARQVDTNVLSRKLSAERIVEDPPTPPPEAPLSLPTKPGVSPLQETILHSRYSTDIFDTLQTYRGIPSLDLLSPDMTIKLSLGLDNTAAPRDDPRFVIWATSSPTRLLVAATIERWMAQLTSELNYDELLNFFLTYRTYVSSVDLCHLLICRFHWSLERPAGEDEHEMARRIVRVRTFVAMRYWLLTFFNVDFVPNRGLRLLLAGWLNALLRDPVLKKHVDGVSIVRKLIKVAKDCKKVHTDVKPTHKRRSHLSPSIGEDNHVLGKNFAAATRKTVDDEDSDVELDFTSTEGIEASSSVNAHLNSIHLGGGFTAPTSTPFASSTAPFPGSTMIGHAGATDLAFVQTTTTLPLHHSVLSRAFVSTMGRLGKWKRVLNNSRRLPNARTSNQIGDQSSLGSRNSAFDLELTASPGELLAVKGGMRQYLEVVERHSIEARAGGSPSALLPTPKLMDIEPQSLFSHDIEMTLNAGADDSVSIHDTPATIPSVLFSASTPLSDDVPTSVAELPQPEQNTDTPAVSPDEDEPPMRTPSLSVNSEVEDESSDAVSFRSSSSDSLGGEASSRFKTTGDGTPWQFDVVSIDELDFSDTSDHEDGEAAPPGLRPAARKLPLRRDFEFVRRSQSVSSMGMASHESMASGQSSSAVSSAAGIGGPIQQWQMNALVDSLDNDNEETGDVEAALRRLEGQINPSEKQEKASKVDGWIKQMQDRIASGDTSDNAPRYPGSDDEDDDEEEEEAAMQSPDDGESEDSDHEVLSRARSISDATPLGLPNASGSLASAAVVAGASKPDDAVPIEILQSRVSSRPSTANSSTDSIPLPVIPSASAIAQITRELHSNPQTKYRSWIILNRAEAVAEHFAMIDRELFMNVKFEELISGDWTVGWQELDIRDWGKFLKDRATWKAANLPGKTTGVATVRARFNLVVYWTISEICRTHHGERASIVSKFIRIAWKSYLASSFNTLVAIIAGLTDSRVDKAMQKHKLWTKVGVWETRILKDLKVFVSPVDEFKYLRAAIETMVDAKPVDLGSSHPPSVISNDAQSGKSKSTMESKAAAPPSCIPFIGVYLAELHRLNQLPDLIDPTSPNERVNVDADNSNFDAPAHPEVFSALPPLPASMQLEPLINVHKQRLIAGVIKSLVAGQHLAGRVSYVTEKKVFHKCLKLNAEGALDV